MIHVFNMCSRAAVAICNLITSGRLLESERVANRWRDYMERMIKEGKW